MKTIPHDYYLKFLDPEVLDEILHFHNKGNFTLHESVENISYLHNLSDECLRDLTGNELRLYPDMEIVLPKRYIGQPIRRDPLARNPSCELFSGDDIPFDTIAELMTPLLCKENSHKRGYPSAGALYPIEVFCCSLSDKNKTWPCNEKILHLLPSSRCFEILQHSENIDNLIEAILPKGTDMGNPSMALIYIAYIPKTLFKYRYRGYRLALLEAGSMYMLIDLKCKALNLQSRLWSGFTDHMVCKSMGLNPSIFYPICVNFLGARP